MPLYTMRNLQTGEVEEMLISISAMEKLIEDGQYEQVIKSPNLVTHTGNIINKTSSDWKDHLKNIKKNTSRRHKNSIKV